MDFSEYIRKLHTRTVYTDYIAEEQRIAQGCGCKSYYNGHTLQQGEKLDILTGQMNTSAAETSTILGSPIAKCPGFVPPVPPTPPTPSTTIVADLTELSFNVSGTQFISTFTFDPTSTITVRFFNADTSIEFADNIQFNRYDLPLLTPSDAFTITNPTYTPSVVYFSGFPGNNNSIVYANENFGISPSSIITFVSGETLTDVEFRLQKN
jgi:hypothetical protein